MAGGGSLGGDRGNQKRGSLATKRKKKKRVGFVLDMTPLVDIAFLLLTFFMLSTTMNTPQIMEMAVPPEITDVQVKASELFTIQIDDKGRLFYNLGEEAPQPLDMKDLRGLAINENMRLKNRLITSLKVSAKAPYAIVVNVLDELNLAESDITAQLVTEGLERERKFSLMTLTPEEAEELRAL